MADFECSGKYPEHEMTKPVKYGEPWVDGHGKKRQPMKSECTRDKCYYALIIDGGLKLPYTKQ